MPTKATTTKTSAATTKTATSKAAEGRKGASATTTKANTSTTAEKPASAPTIRVARQLLDTIGKAEGKSELGKRLEAANTLNDGSKRITYTLADLDTLQGHARRMGEAEDTDRGTRRSARALVTWIDGLRTKGNK
jgi:hypothetical protein